MECIAELRQICQTTALKDRSNVYMRYVCRFVSIYLTRLLLPTRISAGQVSIAMIVAGILSPLFFISVSPWMFLTGVVCLQIWYLLDCMDGEVARYRHFQKTGSRIIRKEDASITGMYYDAINHYIVNLLVPFSIALGLFRKTGEFYVLVVGMAAALGQVLLLAMHDARHRMLLAHLKGFRHIEVVKREPSPAGVKKQRSPGHWAFIVLHYTMTYPTVMNLALVAAVAMLVWPAVDGRWILLVYLAAGSLVVSSTLIGRMLRYELLDQEFQNEFSVADERNHLKEAGHV